MNLQREPTRIFISYAPEDERYLVELEKHLAQLQNDGLIEPWDSRKVIPGQVRRAAVDFELEAARVILLLVSADFIASSECYELMKHAMERHQSGKATVFPVLVRPCDWTSAPFGKLRPLPDPATPISACANQDAAFLKVATTIRAAVEGQDICLLDLDTESARIRPYTDIISRQIGAMDFVPRTVRSDMHGSIRAGNDSDGKFDIAGGDALFIEGWSGRGKTMLLRLLARKAIEKGQGGHVPIFIRAERVTHTVPRAILDELSQATCDFENEASLTSWMNSHPTLLLIDDWHHTGNSSRRCIEEFMDMLLPTGMAIAIAGAPSSRPRLRNLHRIRVNRYSIEERDAVIRAFFGDTSLDRSGWILKSLPRGVVDLLLEPIILEKCLSLIRWSPAAGMRFPVSLPDLMDSLLERMLTARHENPRRRATDVTRVCVQLTKGPRRIRCESIADAMRHAGINEDTSSFVEDLEASGIFRREGTNYEFEHDIWRRAFDAKACMNEGQWEVPEDIRRWVASTIPEELFSMLPFAAGLIYDPEAQNALFDALLNKDLELYFHALTARADVRARMSAEQWATWCLDQLYDGYIGLTLCHFPNFVPYVEPWRFADDDSGDGVVLHGKFHPPNLTYYFCLGRAEDAGIHLEYVEPAVALDGVSVMDEIPYHEDPPPENETPILGFSFHRSDRTERGIDLAATFMRPGSTRLIAARLLLENISETIKEKELEVPWFVRERFGAAFVRTDREGSYETWLKQTVSKIVTLASSKLGTRVDNAAGGELGVDFSAEHGSGDLEELVATGGWLINHGFGDVALVNIVLPGPEYDPQREVLFYTSERRIARVDALYRAVVETYRTICEGMSDSVRSFFFFAQWPCRAIAEIEMIDGDNNPGLYMIWEPCESWETPPSVSVVLGRSMLLVKNYEQANDEMRQRCLQWGRPFDYMRAKSGMMHWAPSSDAVTECVSGLLLSDIKRMQDLLGHGM